MRIVLGLATLWLLNCAPVSAGNPYFSAHISPQITEHPDLLSPKEAWSDSRKEYLLGGMGPELYVRRFRAFRQTAENQTDGRIKTKFTDGDGRVFFIKEVPPDHPSQPKAVEQDRAHFELATLFLDPRYADDTFQPPIAPEAAIRFFKLLYVTRIYLDIWDVEPLLFSHGPPEGPTMTLKPCHEQQDDSAKTTAAFGPNELVVDVAFDRKGRITFQATDVADILNAWARVRGLSELNVIAKEIEREALKLELERRFQAFGPVTPRSNAEESGGQSPASR